MGRREGQIGKRGEQWIERETGGEIKRTRNRPRFSKLGDFAPWRHPTTGHVYQLESKCGANAEPKKVRKAIEQARDYCEGAIPIAVFRNLGSSDPIAALPLRDLLRLLGLIADDDSEQLLLGRTDS